MPINYNKWDNIELSDDDDDNCHPNIDKNLWRKIKKRDREERDAKIAAETKVLSAEVTKAKADIAELTKKMEEMGGDSESDKKIEALRNENAARLEKLADFEMNKKWNADNMCHVAEERTILNRAAPEVDKDGYVIPKEQLEKEAVAKIAAAREAKAAMEDTTQTKEVKAEVAPEEDNKKALSAEDEVKMVNYSDFVEQHQELMDKFMHITDNDQTAEVLRVHSQYLFQEHASSYLLLACLEEEMNGKRAAMKRIAFQSQVLSNITQLAKSMGRHPGAFILPFFKRVKDDPHKTDFKKGVSQFVDRIIARAIEKKKEQAEEPETEEVQLSDLPVEERLGPGGLDPVEVFESLPKQLQEAFTSREMEPLKAALMAMKPEDAEYHMDRCSKAGLWNAGGD